MTRKRAKKTRKSIKNLGLDVQLVRALSHPLRARALAILNERVASPKEIAAELDMPLGNVSYHVNTLHELGCIQLVKEEQRRGATEHYFRGVTRSFFNDEHWARLAPDAKTEISIAGLKIINKAADRALAAGTFDSRDNRHLSCSPLTLDEEGWGEVADLLSETLERVTQIQGKSANRQAESETKQEPIRAFVGLLSFETPINDPEGSD
jgi:DNA-binding transcriptional ArsR family regulator